MRIEQNNWGKQHCGSKARCPPGLLVQRSMAVQVTLVLSLLLCGCAKELPQVPMRAPAAIAVDPPSVTITAGSRLQLRAQVNDAQSQPIGGATISFSSDKPAIVDVTMLGLLSAPGPFGDAIVSVSSGVRTARVSVHVIPGVAAALALVRGPVPKPVVHGAMGDIQVRVQDAFNNPVPDVALTWQVSEGSGTLESSEAKTATDGTASVQWVAGQHAGEQTLTVHSGELRALVVRAPVAAGPATTLALNTDPALKAKASVTQGSPLKIWAVVDDQYGNPVGNVPVHFQSEGRCRLEPVAKSTNGAGASEPVDWSPDATGNCIVIARLEDPAIDARLPLTVIRDRKRSRR